MGELLPHRASELRHELAQSLREAGALRDDRLAEAFGSVSRHLFLPEFHTVRDGRWVRVDLREDEQAAAAVYRDRTFVTALDDLGRPTVSGTAPSTVAFMLGALDLQKGMRVLEIGCGTGYNAALIAAVTRSDVVTVDPSPVAVAGARHALARRRR